MTAFLIEVLEIYDENIYTKTLYALLQLTTW